MKALFLFVLFLAPCIHAQNWTPVNSVPTAGRDDAASFALNGYGYIVTGYLGTFAESSKLFQYDPNTDSWSEKALFPGTARQYSSVFTIQNKAYLLGGYSESGQALKDLWVYDGFTDSWTQLNDFPGLARWHATALNIQNTGYFGMGTTSDSTLSDFWKYNVEMDSWTTLPDYPGGPNRSVLGFPLLGQGIFGQGFDINPITYSDSWYAFNPATETWNAFPAFPGGKRAYGTAVSNNFSAIVCGGMDENSVFKNDCYYLDHSKTWKAIQPLPLAGLRGAKGFAVNGQFFVGTGLNSNFTRIPDFYRLEQVPKNASESLLFPNPSKDYFNLITEANAAVSVYNIGGHLVKQLRANDSGFLEITNLPLGLYVLMIEGEKGSEIRKIARI